MKRRQEQFALPWVDAAGQVTPPPGPGRTVRLKMVPSQPVAQTVMDTRPPDLPKTRGDCVDGPRPCQWTQCRYHLHAVHGDDRPGRRWRPSDARPSQVRRATSVTCALDVTDAEPDGLQRKVVGRLLGVTKERIGQIEELAVQRMRVALALLEHDKGRCSSNCPACAR